MPYIPIMTADDLRIARENLGLTQAGLAEALGMRAKHGGRTVRRWELGQIEVPGVVKTAIKLMIREHKTTNIRRHKA